MRTFDDFLQERFMDKGEYAGVGITEDNWENMFEWWLGDLDVQELMDLAEEYAGQRWKEGLRTGLISAGKVVEYV